MGKTQHLQKSENVDLAYIEACCDTYDKLGDERFCWILHHLVSFFKVEFSRLWGNPYKFILKLSKTSSILS